MSPVAVQERSGASGSDGSQAHGQRLFEPGGATLEDSILGVWGELAAHGRAECPVCGGSMSAAGGCEGCGAELT